MHSASELNSCTFSPDKHQICGTWYRPQISVTGVGWNKNASRSTPACHASGEGAVHSLDGFWLSWKDLFPISESPHCVSVGSPSLVQIKQWLFQLLPHFDSHTICVSRIPLSRGRALILLPFVCFLSFFNSPILSTRTDAHMHGWEKGERAQDEKCVCTFANSWFQSVLLHWNPFCVSSVPLKDYVVSCGLQALFFTVRRGKKQKNTNFHKSCLLRLFIVHSFSIHLQPHSGKKKNSNQKNGGKKQKHRSVSK